MSAPATLAFGSKAETLERLEGRLRAARVLPQVRFTVRAWHADAAGVLERVRARGWLERAVIVRSSALDEDGGGASLAGRYRSLADRRGAASVRTAVDAVAGELRDDDQVFVQPQLERIAMSGVALTRDPSNGSRYSIVEYDKASGRADGITSGRAEERRTWIRHRDAPGAPDGELADVVALLDELALVLASDALDVELARTEDGTLWLLQVRPLLLPRDSPADGADELRALEQVRARIVASSRPHPYVWGERAVFGTMPDWNPAEVIGVRPKPLATSLYKDLVTDSIWAYQRSNYGYRNLRSQPLLIALAGLPYVDVRASFNSFVPADVDPDLGRRLVDCYTQRLLESPLDHDKIEFAIVCSCYSLDLDERLNALRERGFSRDECGRLAASLRRLTNRITAGPASLFRGDVARIAELERRQNAFAIEGAELDLASRIYWMLEDCKRYGTLPFAGIARAAFVAVQMLDSLVAAGVLSLDERERFLRSLCTVRARMSADLARLPRDVFLARYGHLRPGTYDVTSPRYDAAPDDYFDWSAPAPAAGEPAPTFALAPAQRRRLDALLDEHGLEHDHASLFAFLRAAIEQREHAKFVFTKSLSDALELLVRLAAEHGFSRDDVAYADVEILRRLVAESGDPRELLAASIEAGRRRYAVTRRLTLPPLIAGPDDVFEFHLPVCEPSFVTMSSVQGPVVTVESRDLRGGIVMIPSADPGYDWIFARGVAAFVTMHGGYNSHMAIRASELGLPAVVGAGEALFRAWSAARSLRVHCANRRVEVLA